MRIRPSLILLVLIAAALPVLAAAPAAQDYDLQIIEKVAPPFEKPDHPGIFFLKVQFKLTRTSDNKLTTDFLDPADKIVVKEDGKPVAEIALDPPKADALSVVLAMDISGSMASNGKIEEARTAGGVFFDKLDPRTDCGLILFDHQMRVVEKPAGDPRTAVSIATVCAARCSRPNRWAAPPISMPPTRPSKCSAMCRDARPSSS